MQLLAVQRLATERSARSSIPTVVGAFSVFAARVCQIRSRPRLPTTLLHKMHVQRFTRKHIVVACRVASRAQQLRRLATAPPSPKTPQFTPSSQPYRHEDAEPERSWVAQKIRTIPIAFKIVRALGRAMGYGSTKQVAGRRTLAMYEQVCAIKASEDRVFWQEGDHPPSACSLFVCGLTPGCLSL